jgi:hypothetical protein
MDSRFISKEPSFPVSVVATPGISRRAARIGCPVTTFVSRPVTVKLVGIEVVVAVWV